ncbi:aldo/keto reductase [Aquimarina sp. D1M17]|uniref:aldo/keto reductase n=1 Tax=Aquimarina acroporae TaxID=2937283 RepID=UPI0020C0BB96|nr:aldo/keto reductase [Aquimarina acroporae]MCK8523334.1 aldo/keto reductase [Aquimarina acroporae]
MTNKLILGTVQLGLAYGINNQLGKPTLDKAFQILHTAYDNGIRTLDTAEAYGDSQEVIGAFQKKYPHKKFNIITKLSVNLSLKKDELRNHILSNCETLHTDKLLGYMFHNHQGFKKNLDLYDEVLKIRNEGIIEKAGISLYTNDEIEDIIDNYSDFDFIQIPFNLFDNQSKRKDVLEKAKAKNIEIHTRSVFLQGLFFKKIEDIKGKLETLRPYMETLTGIKEKHNLNTQTLTLQYVLQKKYIDAVLIGVESEDQLLGNLSICNGTIDIPHDLIDQISVKEEELLNPSNWN